MKDNTRYAYEKRIKALEHDLFEASGKLTYYKNVCSDIFNTMTDHMHEGEKTSHGWILKQFGRLWK